MARSGFTSTRARIKLRRILQNSDGAIKDALKDAANSMEKEMRARAPAKTGNLRDNISSAVSGGASKFTAEVGFRGKKAKKAAYYARFVEFGTKGHGIDTATRKVLSGDGVIYGTKADHPGIAPRPFIGPTWDAKKPEVQNRVTRAINEALKKAQNL